MPWPRATGQAAPTILNASFETPSVGGGFAYAPGGADWAFAAAAGISGNGGPFYAGSAPDGTQAGFLQSGILGGDPANYGIISQTITGLTAGSTYVIQFYLASRDAPFAAVDPLNVTVGGVDLGTFSNASLTFVQQTTGAFTATSSTALLTFTSNTVFGALEQDAAIDLVTITERPATDVPEPTSIAVLLAGIGIVGAVRRKRA